MRPSVPVYRPGISSGAHGREELAALRCNARCNDLAMPSGAPALLDVVDREALEPHRPAKLPATWNDRERILVHRDLPPSERIRLTIEASRAALRFARGRRIDVR
jgi:hypothetical protein